jgi:uncharacterized protein
MSRIFWDTNLFIYLLGGHPVFSAKVKGLAGRMEERGDELFTSALTLGEVLVRPTAVSDTELVDKIESIIRNRAVVTAFDDQASRYYAAIRCDTSIKAPDAIQLACAAKLAVDMFITNDDRLTSKKVAGVNFVASLEHASLVM